MSGYSGSIKSGTRKSTVYFFKLIIPLCSLGHGFKTSFILRFFLAQLLNMKALVHQETEILSTSIIVNIHADR